MKEEMDSMKESRAEYGMPKASLNTNKGANPGVKRLEKHGLKSGFFTKKGMKGDC